MIIKLNRGCQYTVPLLKKKYVGALQQWHAQFRYQSAQISISNATEDKCLSMFADICI